MRIKLSMKFFLIILVAALVTVPVGVSFGWRSWERQASAEMLEKARILSAELDAFWRFMEHNEDIINSDSDGSYQFKGLYCVVAAKAVGVFVTTSTDYTIRYTDIETRKKADAADPFELEALQAFYGDRTMMEYYALTDYEGKEAFRYLKVMEFTDSCMKCHGEPAGEYDVVGYKKEGFHVGDVAGAVSIVMPVDTYMSGIRNNVGETVGLFTGLVLVLLAVIGLGMSKLIIRPLSRLEETAAAIAEGNFDTDTKPISNNDEIGDLANQIDVMSRELKALTTGLEAKVDERTEELAEANEELNRQGRLLQELNDALKRENEYKSDYLATMSHELKTPLTSMLAFIEIWEKDARANGNQDELSSISEIRDSGHILLGIVNNILEMSRIDAGYAKLSLEPVDVGDLFSYVESYIGSLASKKGLDLSFAVDEDVSLVWADWEKLRRILENLISNSIKYTRQGGAIAARAKLSNDGQSVVFVVEDNGIGIKEEELEGIFEKYSRASSPNKNRFTGTGLGLTVVKELAEMHGGSVDVESTYRVGSTFRVAIPIREEQWRSPDEDYLGR